MLIKGEDGKFKHVPGKGGEQILPRSMEKCGLTAGCTSWDGRISIHGHITSMEMLSGYGSFAILISTERGPENSVYSINIDKIHEGRDTDPPIQTRPLERKTDNNG